MHVIVTLSTSIVIDIKALGINSKIGSGPIWLQLISAALFPVTLFRVAMKATEAALAMLASEGTQRDLLDLMQTRDELYDLLGYRDFEVRDRAYFRPT